MRTRLPYLRSTCAFLAAAVLSPATTAQFTPHFGVPGSHITVAKSTLPRPLTGFTVEFWCKSAARIRQPVLLVSRWDPDEKASDGGDFYVGFASANRVIFGLRNKAGTVTTAAGNFRRRDASWHHIAATFDGTNLRVFIDGKESGSTPTTEFGPVHATDLPLRIGPRAAKKTRQQPTFDGFLSEVRVFTEARTAAMIADERSAPCEGDEKHLAAYLPLFERSPTDAVESPDTRTAGTVSAVLARVGWSCTATWRTSTAPGPDLFCFAPETNEEFGNRGRHILIDRLKPAQVGVLWQGDAKGKIRVTWVAPTLSGQRTIEIEGEGRLAAGTADPKGNLYYLVIGSGPRNRPETEAIPAFLYKASPDGKPLGKLAINTGRRGFNVWSYSGRWGGNLRFSKGTLGLVLPRTMYMAGDGLRHQGAIAVTFSTKKLTLSRMLGTTSSHSMGNILSLGAKGDFLCLDLGDNYPRGVHLHKFTATNKTSGVIFTYKTAHGTRPRNGSPPYPEISKDGKRFFKWSNDNATYTELGGIIENRKGYDVFFATDQSPEGKVLDNSRAFRGCDDPRNLAMLRINRAFQKGRGSVVSNSIFRKLSKNAPAEEGGFFNFAGRWSQQRVVGVTWLTKYAKGEAARNPQAVPMRDGSTWLLWEKTGGDAGRVLQSLTIDKKGRIGETVQLPLPVNLHPRDRMLPVGDRVFFLARSGRNLRLFFRRDGK